jgi:hypothetical protein
MPKKITIIRHAESLFNSGVFEEHELKNCRITENGKNQAKQLDLKFDLLILSPLKRAIETYANSNIKTTNIIISHLFREWKTSGLNMLDGEDETQTETLEQMELRAQNALLFLKTIPMEENRDINIGIISHHDFTHCFFKIHSGQNISLINCGYIPFTIL